MLLARSLGRDRDVVEEARDAEPALHYVERIARTKAQVGWQRMQNRKLAERPVLGADTEVVLDGEVFGKPRDAADAIRMLKRLSGRTHQVLTAVAIRFRDVTEVDLSISKVTLRRLAAAEIERYVATGEPLDKAGGYAVQGRAAAFHRPHRRKLFGHRRLAAVRNGDASRAHRLPRAITATLLRRCCESRRSSLG